MSTLKDPAITTTPSGREIRMERIFNAPRQRVWKAITEPELLAQWWGRGNKLVIEKYEFQRGGHWRFVERSDRAEHGFEGQFREISPIERMVLTFEWDGMPGQVILQTIVLDDLGDGRTQMVELLQFHTVDQRDGMLHAGIEGGANESYAALDRVLETWA